MHGIACESKRYIKIWCLVVFSTFPFFHVKILIEWEKYSDLGGDWDSGFFFFFFFTFIFYFWIVLLTWMMGYMENCT